MMSFLPFEALDYLLEVMEPPEYESLDVLRIVHRTRFRIYRAAIFALGQRQEKQRIIGRQPINLMDKKSQPIPISFAGFPAWACCWNTLSKTDRCQAVF